MRSREIYHRRCRIEALEDRALLSLGATGDYDEVSPVWFVDLQSSRANDFLNVASAPWTATVGPSPAPVYQRWIVRLTPEATAQVSSVEQAAELLNGNGTTFTLDCGLGLPGQILVCASGDAALATAALQANPNVAEFERDGLVSAAATVPQDPSWTKLWGLHQVDATQSTRVDIQAPEAWDRTTGSPHVVTAVLDSGVDLVHEDLYQNIWINQGEIPSALRAQLKDTDGDGLITFRDLNVRSTTNGSRINGASVTDSNGNDYIDAQDLLDDYRWADGADNDPNGFTDDLFGWDFLEGDRLPQDDLGHGTHVAGTIGATGNNNVGVTGVNWTTSLMALRFLDQDNVGTLANAIRAINYATTMRGAGVRVINGSWGQWGSASLGLKAAIQAAGNADILYVAAAGNGNALGQGLDCDANPFYPACFDLPNILSVAASDPADRLATFSNYGRNSVDLAAPGVGIWSTLPDNQYGSMNGTSMAAPHVSGAAALVWAAMPNRTVAEVRAALVAEATTGAAFGGKTAAGGRLNIGNAMQSKVFAPKVTGFQAAEITQAGNDPQEITVTYSDVPRLDRGSFDVDDIVVTHQSGDQEVLVPVGPPTISPPVNWSLIEASTIVQGDFNGDKGDELVGFEKKTGKWWVACWQQQSENGNLVNRFVTEDWGIGPATTYPNLLVGDFDGNGTKDLVWLQDVVGQRECWVGLSQGNHFVFSRWDTWGADELVSFQVGNFDGVGGDDVALLLKSHEGDADWWVGVSREVDGQWQFDHGTARWGSCWTSELLAVQVGDFDNDGRDDIVWLTAGYEYWYVSHSQGDSFKSVYCYTSAPNATWAAIVVGDFNADGRDEVAGLESTPERAGIWYVSHLLTETPPEVPHEPPEPSWFGFENWGWWGTTDLTAVRVGDFSGDGRDDILGVVGQTGSWWVSRSLPGQPGGPTGSFVAEYWGGSGVTEWTAIEVGDFDGDHIADAAGLLKSDGAAWTAGQWWVQRSDTHRFQPELWLDSSSCDVTYSFAPLRREGETEPGTWDPMDYGTYEVSLVANQIKNADFTTADGKPMTGVYAPAEKLGSFKVKIPDSDVFYVDSTADAVDTNLDDGQALADTGDRDKTGAPIYHTTLRAAIQQANALRRPITIFVDPGTYALAIPGRAENQAATGDLDITGTITIRGAGATATIVDARGLDRVFDVLSGATLTIRGVTCRGGDARTDEGDSWPGKGGGLRNQGNTTLEECEVTDNRADHLGGGVASGQGVATLLMRRCAVTDNLAVFGGGIGNSGSLTLKDSTVANNLALGDRGGIENWATIGIENSTISGNRSPETAAMVNWGVITMVNATVTGNVGRIGGVVNNASAENFYLKNCLIAGNFGDTKDVYGGFVSGGHNLIGVFGGSSNSFREAGDHESPDAARLLGPLQANGGPTYTHALLQGNPAIDAGDSSGAPTTDQRGITRTANIDIGAYERAEAEIRGLVYCDWDDDRVRDPDEPGLAGCEVYLDTNGNGVLDPGEPTTKTLADDPTTCDRNESGEYAFTGLLPGDYRVAQVFPTGWRITTGNGNGMELQSAGLGGQSAEGSSQLFFGAVSADGQRVTFASTAQDLVAGDPLAYFDVFVRDRASPDPTIHRLTNGLSGEQPNGDSGYSAISADGRFVTYTSTASNLVSGDGNGDWDVFVCAVDSPVAERVSVAGDGTEVHGRSQRSAISGDGRYVVFDSTAADLVTGDNNGLSDVFLVDRQTSDPEARIKRISTELDGSGFYGWQGSSNAAISDDGRYVVFVSGRTSHGPVDSSNYGRWVYRYDTLTGNLRCVSEFVPNGTSGADDGATPSLSADGRFVAFDSFGTLMDGTYVRAIYVYDASTHKAELVSVPVSGSFPDGPSASASISDDGRYVAFRSLARNLVPWDRNDTWDVFLYDRTAKTTAGLSVAFDGKQGNAGSIVTVISGDGSYVAFESDASNLAQNDRNGLRDVFVAATPLARRPFCYPLTLHAGDTIENLDFGMRPELGAISGTVFHDVNRNGRQDVLESGLEGFTVFIDQNANGRRDDGERLARLNADGTYELDNVIPFARYTLACEPPANSDWVLSYPGVESGGTWSVYVDPEVTVADRDFGYYKKPSVAQGTVSIKVDCYQDVDGARQPLSGLVLYLDKNNDGQRGTDEPRAVESGSGSYRFTVDDVGTYTVRVEPQAVWKQVDPGLDAGGRFWAPTAYSLGGNILPQALAVGEFTGDDSLDLAVASGGANGESAGVNNITVWRQELGKFAEATRISLLETPTALAAGDFDRTGPADLAVACSPTFEKSRIFVLHNNGTKWDSLEEATVLDAGTFVSELVVAKVNNDPYPDLVIANLTSSADGSVWIYFGSAGGGFSGPTKLNVAPGTRAVAVADVNQDGNPDLAVASFYQQTVHQVTIWTGDGNGNFSSYASVDCPYPVALAAGKFDSDDYIDFAVADSLSGNVSVLRNEWPNAVFTQRAAVYAGQGVLAIAQADLDGDKKLDIIATEQVTRQPVWLRGDGNGTFEPRNLLGAGSLKDHVACVAVADFYKDDDSIPDFAVAFSASDDLSGSTPIPGRFTVWKGGMVDGARLVPVTNVVPGAEVSPPPFVFRGANERPSDIHLLDGAVYERSGADTRVGTLQASDPNTGDTFRYELVAGAGDTDNAKFQIVGNQLMTAAVIDAQTQSTCSIRVRVTDGAGLTLEKAISIAVVSRKADMPGLYVPDAGSCFLREWQGSGPAQYVFPYGPPGFGWTPLSGDWDGDGVGTVGLYDPRTSTFYLRNEHQGGAADWVFTLGVGDKGWQPLVGDWNGDGRDTVALYEPATSIFFFKNSLAGGDADEQVQFGMGSLGWQPIVGDWNGDGCDGFGFYEPSISAFWLKNARTSGPAEEMFQFGMGNIGWVPLAGNWDGLPGDGVGFYVPQTSQWFLKNAHTPGDADTTFVYGVGGQGWQPLVGRWHAIPAVLSSAPAAAAAPLIGETGSKATPEDYIAATSSEASRRQAIDQIDLAALAAAQLHPAMPDEDLDPLFGDLGNRKGRSSRA